MYVCKSGNANVPEPTGNWIVVNLTVRRVARVASVIIAGVPEVNDQ